jgi:hypothetical protein
VTVAQNPYMKKTEAQLRGGRAKLDGLWAKAEKAGHQARLEAGRKLKLLEARYADVKRRFEKLQAAGTAGIADLKVGLEKALDAFGAAIGGER